MEDKRNCSTTINEAGIWWQLMWTRLRYSTQGRDWRIEVPPIIGGVEVWDHLKNKNTHKSMWPNKMHSRVLRELADAVTKPHFITFEKSWQSAKVSMTGEKGILYPFSKSVKMRTLENTKWPASTLGLVRSWNRSSWKPCQGIWKTGRWLERANKGKSCLTNLVAFYNGVTALDQDGG